VLIQDCLSVGETFLKAHYFLSEHEWSVIAPLLPAERGRWARPSLDNRPFFEGMMWIARTGAQPMENGTAFISVFAVGATMVCGKMF
jgi:hypothetical protein